MHTYVHSCRYACRMSCVHVSMYVHKEEAAQIQWQRLNVIFLNLPYELPVQNTQANLRTYLYIYIDIHI